MGFVDGRNLENRSVPLIKMEVDVATLAQLNQEISDRTNADNTERQARIDAINASNGALAAHIAVSIHSGAHGGEANADTLDGYHAGSFAMAGSTTPHQLSHQSGHSDALTGTLSVSITGSAYYAG